jgi:hypothetical protein
MIVMASTARASLERDFIAVMMLPPKIARSKAVAELRAPLD